MATYYDLTQTGAQVQTILDTSLDADYVVYDNTNSGLAATDVQAAIDEVAGTTITAAVVTYDNTNSGLVATDAQDAIDELRSADNITYDNTNSGLASTNVQDAIDEITSEVGQTVSDSESNSTSLAANTATSICSVSLGAGVWVITGALRFASLPSGRVINAIADTVSTPTESQASFYSPSSVGSAGLVVRNTVIVTLANTTTMHLVAYSQGAVAVSNGYLDAVRIK